MSVAPPQKRIAFFLFESRELSTYPTITNAALLLADSGFAVDIYLPEHMICESPGRNIELVATARSNSADYIRNTVQNIRISNRKYSFYFAAYFEGLAIATLLQKHIAVPVIYISMELIYKNYAAELDAIINTPTNKKYAAFIPLVRLLAFSERIWKFLPVFLADRLLKLRDSQGVGRVRSALAHKKVLPLVLKIARDVVSVSLVQDEHREAVLRKEFDFVNKTILLPNSYIGFDDGKSEFATTRFGISAGKKIILYSGAVEHGFDRNFFDLSRELSDDFVLFVNAYSRDGYLDSLRDDFADQIQSGRLVLNESLLTDSDYALLVKSSLICLAWYGRPEPGDDNMYYLGLSSGKMNRYLACGRPVIVPDYYFGYRDLMEKNGIGVACSDVTELAGAIAKIENDYGEYQSNVKRFFQDRLEFKKCFQPVLNELDSIEIGAAECAKDE